MQIPLPPLLLNKFPLKFFPKQPILYSHPNRGSVYRSSGMFRLVLLGSMLVGCGSDEKEAANPVAGVTIKSQYEKIYFVAAGDQIGALPEETEAVLENSMWVKQAVISAGTEDIAGCPGKSPDRVRYTFKWLEAGSTDYVYYWSGVALAAGKKFISGCYSEGSEDSELTCRHAKCEDI